MEIAKTVLLTPLRTFRLTLATSIASDGVRCNLSKLSGNASAWLKNFWTSCRRRIVSLRYTLTPPLSLCDHLFPFSQALGGLSCTYSHRSGVQAASLSSA
jgi:hypothetical protein